jgi:hypothetical protein
MRSVAAALKIKSSASHSLAAATSQPVYNIQILEKTKHRADEYK